MRQTGSDILQVIRLASAKLTGLWPTLLALVLAGFTAKLATVRLATLAASLGWVFGVLITAFSAAGMLALFTLAIRAMLPARPWPPFARLLAPFLVIYVAMGHFDGYVSGERPVRMDVAAASILLGAVLLRWLLPLWPAYSAWQYSGWVRTGLDICWMSLTAFTVATHPAWHWLSGLSAPATRVLTTAITVLVVPLAWLVLGAFALGLPPVALRPLAQRAGLPLILGTSLLILAVQLVPPALWEINRLVLGARDPETFWQPVTGLIGAANNAVGVLLVLCLVGGLLTYSGADEPGIAGHLGPRDMDGDRVDARGRHEEDGHLIGV